MGRLGTESEINSYFHHLHSSQPSSKASQEMKALHTEDEISSNSEYIYKGGNGLMFDICMFIFVDQEEDSWEDQIIDPEPLRIDFDYISDEK